MLGKVCLDWRCMVCPYNIEKSYKGTKGKSNNNVLFTLHFTHGAQGGHVLYFIAIVKLSCDGFVVRV